MQYFTGRRFHQHVRERRQETRKNHQTRAKMQHSLFLFILIGQCAFVACQLYEYHFIKDNKTWEEARDYCRKEYTDLATVYDMKDLRRLRDSAKLAEEDSWIGLYDTNNSTWHWSLPGVEYNEDHNTNGDLENCMRRNSAYSQSDDQMIVSCTEQYKFICYNETIEVNETFHLINTKMTWLRAQNYCREHYTDLISGLVQLEHEDFINKTKYGSSEWFWIGLFKDTWGWSDESNSSFRYWDEEETGNDMSSGEPDKGCAVLKKTSGRLGSEKCNESKPFVCYDENVILINESKTWMDALNHCRENHNDLVSITNHNEQRWVQERAKKANSSYVWLGLRYTCALDLWFWVNDELVSYDKWSSQPKIEECDVAVAMEKEGENRWFSKCEEDLYNFICLTKQNDPA